MPFALNDDKVLEVTVEAQWYSQFLITRFQYQYSDPTAPLAGNSATFLTNFRTAFRTHIIPICFTDYIVTRYRVDMIMDVVQVAAGPPATFRPVYNNVFDYLTGAAGDVGTRAIAAGADVLPAANCMRIKKNVQVPTRGFYKAGYVRMGGQGTEDLDPDAPEHDRWSNAIIASRTTTWSDFAAESPLGEVGGNGWNMTVWSANFFGRVIKPFAGEVYLAGNEIQSMTCMPFVGTQITRRYKPAGGFSGL